MTAPSTERGLAALLQRRDTLQQRSQALRHQLTRELRTVDGNWRQGLGLWRVAMAAAGVGTAWRLWRRRRKDPSEAPGAARLAGLLRLLPLLWGLWRTVQAARRDASARPTPMTKV